MYWSWQPLTVYRYRMTPPQIHTFCLLIICVPVTLHDIVHTDKSLTLVFEYLERDLKQYMDDYDTSDAVVGALCTKAGNIASTMMIDER